MASYEIVRMRFNGRPRRLPGMAGLSLEMAQEHCSRPSTHARGVCQPCGYRTGPQNTEHDCPKCGRMLFHEWFDGYQEEGRRR